MFNKEKQMTKEQKFVLDNKCHNLIINDSGRRILENHEKIYVSDIMKKYTKKLQKKIKQLENERDNKFKYYDKMHEEIENKINCVNDDCEFYEWKKGCMHKNGKCNNYI
jgi:ABC-type dipeptide/oligopeptide/nickel transport system ATPase component